MRAFFMEWKVRALVTRDVLSQSMKSLQNHSFKRRWEKPQSNIEQVKQAKGQSVKCGLQLVQ